ncbi:hypothetical protein DUZ99_13225 [Xylanibacillus composti]|uniref:O-antigen ligase-related domain-containing protein n=1 Tax=Xylanibacillus composti TaxID=1572762 RepID=A0A8J4H5L7_9BACL|nr:O-antigen ligase family protein [Xylanibacillus composti]MDT9725936.1 hypothetical protein [Xylanibacillus composti]GIQ71249.1 hypothetical protein XYCOK13_40730 [Xylanibacillus composti]
MNRVTTDKLYEKLVVYITLISLFLSIETIYKSYNGLLIAITLNVIVFILISIIHLKMRYKYNLIIFSLLLMYLLWLIITGLSNNGNTVVFDLVHWVYLILFIVTLPSLNDDLSRNIVILKKVGFVFLLFAIIFLVLNFSHITFGVNLLSNSNKLLLNELLYNINIDGYIIFYSTVIWTVMFYIYKNKSYLVYALISLLILLISGVRAAIMGYIVFVLTNILLSQYKKKSSTKLKIIVIIIFIPLIIILMSLVMIDHIKEIEFLELDKISSGRFSIWGQSIELILEKPYVGHGMRGWGEVLGSNQDHWNPHNFVLTIILSYGFIGFTIYMLLFSYIIFKALSIYKSIKDISLKEKMLINLISINFSQLCLFITNVGFYGSYNLESIFYMVFLTIMLNIIFKYKLGDA